MGQAKVKPKLNTRKMSQKKSKKKKKRSANEKENLNQVTDLVVCYMKKN